MHCQKCRAPLRLDTSLEDLSNSAVTLLLDATATSLKNPPSKIDKSKLLYTSPQRELLERISRESPQPATKRSIGNTRQDGVHGAGADSKADMSFIMLTESQLVPSQDEKQPKSTSTPTSVSTLPQGTSAEKPSLKLERAARLFEILSSRSDIDHPVCMECTDALIEGMEKKLAGATKERNAYAEFLKTVQADVPTEEEQRQVDAHLNALREEEAKAMADLEALEAEQASLEKELTALDEESRQLDREEEEFWRERNAFAQTLKEYQDERDSINMRYEHDSALLERLQRTNVYNDTFNISHDGYFGTINGLRLGRMSGSTVEWSEINAAWGQACLLLATVADKLGYQFQGYRLNPMGSTSTIDRFELPQRGAPTTSSTSSAQPSAPAKVVTTTSLSLFHSSDLPLNIGFLHRHFDSAMVAFLECIRQLGGHVERTTQYSGSGGDEGLKLPYEIKKDRIHDCSIKLGFGGDESWTRACKYTLTCCKFLLAHASNIGGARKAPT